jgi:starvation-inducible DNA-binding protein
MLSDRVTAPRAALRVATETETQGNGATADLATQRVTQHEKPAWMLISLLQHSK